MLKAAQQHANNYNEQNEEAFRRVAYSSFCDGVEWTFRHLWHDASEIPSIFGTYMLMHGGGWCVARYYGAGIRPDIKTGWVEISENIPIDEPLRWLDLADLKPKQEDNA